MRLMCARWFWHSPALLLVLASATGAREERPPSPIECRALHDLIQPIDDHTIEARNGLVARLQCAGASSLVGQLRGRFVIDGELRTDLERAAQAGDLDAAFALATKVPGVTPDTLAQLYPTVMRDTVRALGDRYARAIVLTKAALAAHLAAIFLPSGPGISVRPVEGAWLIDFVQAGWSGELMGLLPGDRIERVGGVPVADLSAPMDEVLAAQVDLQITRAAWTEPLVITVGGSPYRPPADVEYDMLPGGIGYLRFRLFFAGLTPMFIGAMHALAARGARGLLLDLRGNGGGAINEAVALADLLVPGKPAIAGVEARDATFALPSTGLRESYHAEGEALPDGLLEGAVVNVPRDLIEWLRSLARASVTRTERQCVTDPSRDSVLRRGIEVLLVHRGDDRHALDAELPPLVEWQ